MIINTVGMRVKKSLKKCTKKLHGKKKYCNFALANGREQ